MDALYEARQSVTHAEMWGTETPELMASLAAVAQAWAAIAAAEQLKRVADALERAYPIPEVDPRQPGQSWDEWRLEKYGTPAEPSPLDNF
jgi:hypothetical protein